MTDERPAPGPTACAGAASHEAPRAQSPGAAARVLLVAIRLYKRWISPLLPPSCRFEPSCSMYAAEAIRTYGAARGSRLALRRLLRCRPGVPGGYDPVPLREK